MAGWPSSLMVPKRPVGVIRELSSSWRSGWPTASVAGLATGQSRQGKDRFALLGGDSQRQVGRPAVARPASTEPPPGRSQPTSPSSGSTSHSGPAADYLGMK